jgi:uncharacterized delta-60 repeat protein
MAMTGRQGRRAAIGAPLAGIGLVACLLLAAPVWASPGQPDPSFGSGGVATYDLHYVSARSGLGGGSAFHAVATAPGDDLDLVGVSNDATGGWRVLVARLSEDGALDPSFGSGGSLLTSYEPPEPRVVVYSGDAEVVGSDGSIVVGGKAGVMEITPSGQLNPNFRQSEDSETEALARMPNGDLLAAGGWDGPDPSSHPGILERRLPDGAPDDAFGTAGTVHLPLHPGEGVEENAQGVLSLADGKVLVAGVGVYRGGASGAVPFLWLVRCNGDGTVDASFGEGGVRYVEGVERYAKSMLVSQPNGRLVLLGTATATGVEPHTHMAAWGFTPEGQPDGSFGEDGVEAIPASAPGVVADARAATVDSEGRILVAGEQWPGNGGHQLAPVLARLDPSGELDRSYGNDGFAVGPPNATFEAVTIDGQGRAIVAGFNPTEGPGSPEIPHEETLVERFLGDGSPGPPSSGNAKSENTANAGGSTSSAPLSLAPAVRPGPGLVGATSDHYAPRRGRACVVPRLTGNTLGTARRMLIRANCKLGHITFPRGRVGVLVIQAQGAPHGRHLPVGAAIAVRLRDVRHS